MEDGKYLDSEQGTPQGNGASPVLASIYLHYVLDSWFNVVVKRQSQGQAYLIRYCDDFVCCFQNKWEAEAFYGSLIERFKKFGLELSLDKTKILELVGLRSKTGAAKWTLFKWLNRRSQNRSYLIDTFFKGLLKTFPIIEPTVKISLFYR